MSELPARIPPHSLDAERAVLGAILLEDRAALPRVADLLTPSDFYTEAHRFAYAGMLALHERGEPVDLLTLQEELRRTDTLALAGGPAALALLIEQGAVAAYVTTYAATVRDLAVLRQLIQTSSVLIGQAFDAKDDARSLVQSVTTALEQIAERLEDSPLQRRHGPQPLRDVLDEVLVAMDEPEGDYVASPIPELNDRLGGGILSTELVNLGGRPGVAKSALALQWAVLAANHGHRTIVFSREMTNRALGRRVLSQQARVAALALRQRRLSDHERARIVQHLPRLGALPLAFDDVSGTIGRIRQVVRAGGYRFVVVDYLQLVRSPGFKDRRLEVSAVSAGLKDLAKRFNCSVLALSSLSRLPRHRGKKQAPDMDALKESGDLEHDADIVLLLHQPDKESPDRELIFEKLREGASGGSVRLAFQPIYVTFDEVPAPEQPPLGAGDVPF